MKITVSIIIPVYNAENTLDRCINSIRGQTFKEWEMILINDGSRDASADICERYALIDMRIRVLNQKNKGASGARNTGICAAQGEYLMFIDSDDTADPTFLEEYVKAIQTMNVDVVIGGYRLIKESGDHSLYCPEKNEIFYSDIWEKICKEPQPFGYLWNKIFKRDIIREWNLSLREDMYSQEDLDFCLSYFDKCCRFGIIQNVDYQYHYIEGKRIPPVWNFIENQLKLSNIAQKKQQLSQTAQKEITERINLLIYTFLYDAERNDIFWKAIENLDNVDGLRNYLECTSVHDEKSFISYEYMKKRCKFLYRYFKCRRLLRNVIQKFR